MPVRRKAALLDRPLAPTDMPSDALLAVRSQELDELVARLVACIPFHVLEAERTERLAMAGSVQAGGGGRPSLLTPANAALALRAMAVGNYPTAAVGLFTSRTTWTEWQAWAADGREPFAAFVAALDIAASYHEVSTVAGINAQAPRSWRAGIALLERRHTHWRLEAAPAPVSAPPVTVNVITVADLGALAGLLAADHAPVQVLDGQLIEGENP